MKRRDFAKLLAMSGSMLLTESPRAWPAPLQETPERPDEKFWQSVREQFLMPPELGVLNAANLCPSPAPVLEAMYRNTKDIDSDPSFDNRQKMSAGKENTRRLVASFLRVTPDEILLTRNTSEANNIVSSGLDLKAGDSVIVFADNHPSNNEAWKQKAARFGFTVTTISQPNPHPGPGYYIDAVTKAITQQTRVIAFTHHTSTVGDVLPARELCRVAREHGVMTLVDGACTFGMLDVDLSDIQPDFYTGSSHKWPCGPKEVGVLYANTRVHGRIHPSIISAYPGAVGIARSMEAMGQRDEPAIIGFGEALNFQSKIGRKAIETRPGNLDVTRLSAALYRNDRIGCATRGGSDRPGIRFSPHIYNTMAEVDRSVAAIAKYMRQGV